MDYTVTYKGYDGIGVNANKNIYFNNEKVGYFGICSGKGEADRGDFAANLVTDFVSQTLGSYRKLILDYTENPTQEKHDKIIQSLNTSLTKASHQIQRAISEDPQKRRMGATLVMGLMCGHSVFLVHVGTSRIHIQRQGELHQLTYEVSKRRHSDELTLDFDKGKGNRFDNALNNFLGSSGDIKIEVLAMELSKGDKLILSNENVLNVLGEKRINKILVNENVDELPHYLVEKSREKDPNANVAVLSIAVEGQEESLGQINPHQKFEVLKQIPLFSMLDYKQMAKVLSNMQTKSFSAGKDIIKQNDKGEELFVILTGKADVLVHDNVVASLSPGDYFGEISLIDKAPRSATVRATEDIYALSME